MKRFTMTYEITTHESSEQGDVAEHGFYEPGGWQYPFPDDPDAPMPEPAYVDLRSALRDLNGLEPNNSTYLDARWWSGIDGYVVPSDGSIIYRAVHLPDNITESSRRRVNRLIKARR